MVNSFQATGNFEATELNAPPNDNEHHKVKRTPFSMLLVSPSPKFQSVSLYDQYFWELSVTSK